MNIADDRFKPKPWLYIGLAIAFIEALPLMHLKP